MRGSDYADAGTGFLKGTGACSINAAGTRSGTYIDGHNVHHGFLSAPDGNITSFGFSGAATGSGQGAVTSEEDPPSPVE